MSSIGLAKVVGSDVSIKVGRDPWSVFSVALANARADARNNPAVKSRVEGMGSKAASREPLAWMHPMKPSISQRSTMHPPHLDSRRLGPNQARQSAPWVRARAYSSRPHNLHEV